MPTTYTPVSGVTTAWTPATGVNTTWYQLSPIGFGIAPFGERFEDIEAGIKIHLRGFGDPLTKWTPS